VSFDPFTFSPGAKVRPESERPELERKGKKIPLNGETKRRKKIDYESMSRALWRERGYIYDKASFTQPYTGKSHDLYGCIDSVAMGHGETVFVQTTSKAAKSAHVKKYLTENWALFGGHAFPILDALRLIASQPHCRFVMCCWHQPGGPGTRWVCEETEVTHSVIDSWLDKRVSKGTRTSSGVAGMQPGFPGGGA